MLESSLRQMRILHGLLPVAVPLYTLAGEYADPSEPRDVKLIQTLLFIIAVWVLAIAAFFRRRLAPALDTLRMRLEEAAALGSWRRANIISSTICESTAVLGFALWLLGGTLWQAATFYAGAFLLMLASTPRWDASGDA